MAKPIGDLQVYVGKELEATKKELEGFGYTVEAFGVAVCSFSGKPAEEKIPAADPTPSDPNKPITLTYFSGHSVQRVRSISQN